MTTWKSRVGWHMIVKNEESVLDRCLTSLKGCWDDDKLVIVDTGSTDRTVEIAKKHGAIVEYFPWINDFGAARQFALEKLIEHCPDIDYCCWCDADDILPDKENVINFRKCLDVYLEDPKIVGIQVPYIVGYENNLLGNEETPNYTYCRVRAVKKGTGKWNYKIHECLIVEGDTIQVNNVFFHHRKEEQRKADDKYRNLNMLKEALKDCPQEHKPRYLFYIAKECTYHDMWDDAILYFKEYLPLSSWLPEKCNATYELGVCYQIKKDFRRAKKYFLETIALDESYVNAYLAMAILAYDRKDWRMCAAWSLMIPQLNPQPPTFFTYLPNSTYRPYDYASIAYGKLGQENMGRLCIKKCLSYRPHEKRFLKNYSWFYRDLFPKVSIIIPVFHDISYVLNCITKIKENAFVPKYDIFIGVGNNVECSKALVEKYKEYNNVKIYSYESKEPIAEDFIIKDLSSKSHAEYICYLPDNYSPLIGFLIHAYEESQEKKLIFLNNKKEQKVSWFSPKKLIDPIENIKQNPLGEYSKNAYAIEYNDVPLKVSIIIPVVRPNLLERCITAIKENAGYENYEIISEQDTELIGCPKMVKKLVEKSTGDAVMFLGDDTIPKPNFLKNAIKQLKAFPNSVGLVALNDGTNRKMLATHWLAHKKLLPLIGGEFFNICYHHCYCDNELSLRTQRLNLYSYCQDSVIEHDNPILKNTTLDEHYKRAYSHIEEDRLMFEKHKKEICT